MERRPEHVGEDHQVWELWVVGGKCVGDKQVDGKIVGPEISRSWNHGSINGSNSQRVIRRISREKELNWLLISYEGQDGDLTMTSSNTSNIKELDADKKFMAHLLLLHKQTSQHDISMLRMDACYLELKVLSRSRRDGSCDFLDHYGYHYGDAIARPLLPSEVVEILLHKTLIFFAMSKVPDVDTSASSIAFQIKDTCNGQRRYDHKGHGSGLVNKKARVKDRIVGVGAGKSSLLYAILQKEPELQEL
ncbi:hypothetical protein Tco_0906042 [Tanacetum coccineum]